MNIPSLMNPQDLNSLPPLYRTASASKSESHTEAVLSDSSESRPSARTRHLASAASSDSASSDLSGPKAVLARSRAKPNGIVKRRSVDTTYTSKAAGTPGSGRNILVASLKKAPGRQSRVSQTSTPTDTAKPTRTSRGRRRPGNEETRQLRPSPTQQLVDDARAAAQHSSHRSKHPVSIMDVVLDAQRPNTRLDIDDLQDAIEECYRRGALAFPASDVDDDLGSMFVPGWYEARQAYLTEGVRELSEDVTPNEIYRVSAVRSTVSWDSCLDSELESSDGVASTES